MWNISWTWKCLPLFVFESDWKCKNKCEVSYFSTNILWNKYYLRFLYLLSRIQSNHVLNTRNVISWKLLEQYFMNIRCSCSQRKLNNLFFVVHIRDKRVLTLLTINGNKICKLYFECKNTNNNISTKQFSQECNFTIDRLTYVKDINIIW